MGCKIVFSPQAIADLESAVRFTAKDNPEAAVRMGHELIERVSLEAILASGEARRRSIAFAL